MDDGDESWGPSGAPAEDYSVCAECFEDEDLKSCIKSSLDCPECDFCHRKARKHNIAARLDVVIDCIIEAVEREYEFAADALGHDSGEGGYQGSHWDSYDLLQDHIGLVLPNDDDGSLFNILVECLGDQVWCERDPYALRKDERLVGSWEQFCQAIKHDRRYFFLHSPKKERFENREYLSSSELLRYIGETVTEYELIKRLPAGTCIYRARQQKPKDVFSSPCDFGPPPVELAVKPNRMSPSGIVMFYGSEERETAIAEIDDDPELGIVAGTFRTGRSVVILDLTKLPRRLGFFEQQSDSSTIDRYVLDFLHSFVYSLAAKVEPGDREHIDYVPTQVITEWFRTVFRYRKARIDGIRYRSAQRDGGKSLVLFAQQSDVVLTPRQAKALAKKRSICLGSA
jgi:HEPN/RES N-terminal domain 1/RES domain